MSAVPPPWPAEVVITLGLAVCVLLVALILVLCIAVLLAGAAYQACGEVASLHDRLMTAWTKIADLQATREAARRKIDTLKRDVDELKELGAMLVTMRPAVDRLRSDLSDFGRLHDDLSA